VDFEPDTSPEQALYSQENTHGAVSA
jgi:hypothetical protein